MGKITAKEARKIFEESEETKINDRLEWFFKAVVENSKLWENSICVVYDSLTSSEIEYIRSLGYLVEYISDINTEIYKIRISW